MARAGRTIEHPVTGERITFLATAADTGGAFLRMELVLAPGGFIAASHLHRRQDERFEVRTGEVGFRLGRERRSAGAGASLAVPKGTPHTLWNAGDREAVMEVEFRPALQTERFFETFFGLGAEGKVGRRGMPHLLQSVLLAQAHDLYLAGLPLVLQRAGIAALAPLARARGYREWYPGYAAGEDPSVPNDLQES